MARYGPESITLKNNQVITLRHCSAEDVAKFADFQQQIAKESTHTLQVEGEVPLPEKVKENWLMCEKDPRYLRLGAFHNDRLIGQLGLRPAQDHPWLAHIASFHMMVLKEYWGQGIGKKLLNIMETHARASGYTRIEATVRIENERGVSFYIKNGYTIEGTRFNAALIHGRYQNEYYIGKI